MMMDISTPALLFGSISLLLLTYTNRFTAVAKFIRELNANKNNCDKAIIDSQIPILRKRIKFIKRMQLFGVLSFIFCTVSLFAIFLDDMFLGELFFTISAVCLLISLLFVLWEVSISTKALDFILDKNQQFRDKQKLKNNEKTMKKQMISKAGDWSQWTPALKEALETSKNNTQVGEKVVFKNDEFRVWSIHLPAGQSLPFHKHQNRYFWTAMNKGKSRSYYDDGSIVDTEYEIGDTKYFGDLNEENFFIHNLQNTGNTMLIFTTVEFLK